MTSMLEMSVPLFSKFHHSLDENNNLCFLFAFSPVVIEGGNLLNVEVFRQSSLSLIANTVVAPSTAPTKVKTEMIDLKVENGEDLIYVGGMDKNIVVGHNYQYTAVIHIIKNQKENPKRKFYNIANSIMSNKSPWISPATALIKYKFSIIKAETLNKLDVNFINNEVGFNYLSRSTYNEGVLVSPSINFIGGQQISFLRNNLFSNTENFLETINKSFMPTVEKDLFSNSCPPRLSSETELILSKEEFINVFMDPPTRNIDFEYLSEFMNSIIVESWQPVDSGVVNNLDIDDKILVRIANPENYSNKYFYISGDK